jgi:hypothetical protein
MEKNPKFFEKWPKQLPSKKCKNVYIKAQFESLKHLHQTSFEMLNSKPCFETAF